MPLELVSGQTSMRSNRPLIRLETASDQTVPDQSDL